MPLAQTELNNHDCSYPMAGWQGLASLHSDSSTSRSLLFSTCSAQTIHTLCTVEKQRKALFLPQWIYILRPSISSWHLVHAAISRWIAVKALHPFTFPIRERIHLYLVPLFRKQNWSKHFELQTFSTKTREKCSTVILPAFQITLLKKELWRK